MPIFKKLNTNIFKRDDTDITSDNLYWKQLKVPVLIKEFGPVDSINFSPVEPHYFAVTCSVRVQIYNPITKLVYKNLSRFREKAYGATFHSEGKLICCGGEEKSVKLFDVSSKSLLRLFRDHTGPVHRTYFVPKKPQIASFSDDKTVKIWDIPTESVLTTFNSHNDYVRAGAINPMAPDIVASGGYDSVVKLYDTRVEKEVISVNHGSPIESLIFLPSGGIFLSAGGTSIKVWDSIAGGKLLGCISQHHKTITCMHLASDNKRLLSGGLDRYVKVYDLNTFKVVHTLDFPNSVLSMGVAKDDRTLVVGLVDGLISIRQKDELLLEKKKTSPPSFEYSILAHGSDVDAVVPNTQNKKQAKYNHFLRKFEYSKALDSVLLPYVVNKTPQVTVAVLKELLKRKALQKSLQGQDIKSKMQLFKFIYKNISDIRFTKILIKVLNVVIDVCENEMDKLPSELVQQFSNLNNLLTDETILYDDLASLNGVMQMLLASQSVTENTKMYNKLSSQKLVPSLNAQKNIVVNIS